MLTNLKVFTAVVVIGGSFIGIPVTLWQTNFLTTTQTEIRTITRKLPQPVATDSNKGNCDVEQLAESHKDFLLAQGQKGSFYIEISCENTGTNSGVGSLSRNWTGLFPAQLIANGEKLSIEEKLNLETEGELSGEVSKTTFKGKGMKRAVVGEWGRESITWGNQSIKPVSFPKNPEITNKLYLIFY